MDVDEDTVREAIIELALASGASARSVDAILTELRKRGADLGAALHSIATDPDHLVR